MDDSLPRLLTGFLAAHGEGRDVVIEPSAAPDASLLMAGNARGSIEDRAESVSAGSQRVARRPFVDEELLSRLGHGGVHCLGLRFRPGQRSQPKGDESQECHQAILGQVGPFHGNPS